MHQNRPMSPAQVAWIIAAICVSFASVSHLYVEMIVLNQLRVSQAHLEEEEKLLQAARPEHNAITDQFPAR